MSRYSACLVDPAWCGPLEEADQAVVEEFDDVHDKFFVAVDLLELLGDRTSADALSAILDRAAEQPLNTLDQHHIGRVRVLISGLEKRILDAGLVEAHDVLTPLGHSRLVAKRSRWIRGDANSGYLSDALLHAMVGISRLRDVLDRALELKLDISLA